jgi:hypothetical protein
MRQWTTIDKSEWGDGPWQVEPDKVVWVDEATGLDCMIHRGNSGALCGYVGVPNGHQWYGQHYDNINTLGPGVDVHGGLTFSEKCDETATEDHGICHVPEPGRPHDVWWLGFDCAHGMDVMPGLEARTRAVLSTYTPSDLWRPTYKNYEYVRKEVESLARQAAEA